MDKGSGLGEESIHKGLPPLNVVVCAVEVSYLFHEVQQLQRSLA